MKEILLWLLRKALYTATGAAVAALAVYMKVAGGPDYDYHTLTSAGAIGAVAAAVFGDLRRALAPDFLQIVSGQDPRSDG